MIGVVGYDAGLLSRWSPRRNASAVMVSEGLALPDVANTEPSHTYKVVDAEDLQVGVDDSPGRIGCHACGAEMMGGRGVLLRPFAGQSIGIGVVLL